MNPGSAHALTPTCFAADVEMRLIEIDRESVAGLPLDYDPDIIAAFWGARPWAVATRVAQLTGIAGGFLSSIAWDIITKKIKEVRPRSSLETMHSKSGGTGGGQR
jgi:aarF domain-containing kinase